MGRPHLKFDHKPTPGPGAYSITFDKSPKIAKSFSGRTKIVVEQKTPGPAEYTLKHESSLQKAPQWKLECSRGKSFV